MIVCEYVRIGRVEWAGRRLKVWNCYEGPKFQHNDRQETPWFILYGAIDDRFKSTPYGYLANPWRMLTLETLR